MSEKPLIKSREISVSAIDAGSRLDLFLTRHFPDLSRSLLTRLIKEQHVLVNQDGKKAGYRLGADDLVSVTIPPAPSSELIPCAVDFTVLYEDAFLLVLIKPPGLVVHPAPGNLDNTLAHGLLHHCGQLPGQGAGRPGIVHRLDKDTSGILVAAKTEAVLRQLSAAFKARQVEKKYLALLAVCPKMDHDRVNLAVGRHPVQRQKMSVNSRNGRHAVSSYQVLEHLQRGVCLVEVAIETGRTHQIRVHMAAIGCPILGDPLYGGKNSVSESLGIHRQMLHAGSLALRHPVTGEQLHFTAALWPDMLDALGTLRAS